METLEEGNSVVLRMAALGCRVVNLACKYLDFSRKIYSSGSILIQLSLKF